MVTSISLNKRPFFLARAPRFHARRAGPTFMYAGPRTLFTGATEHAGPRQAKRPSGLTVQLLVGGRFSSHSVHRTSSSPYSPESKRRRAAKLNEAALCHFTPIPLSRLKALGCPRGHG